MVDVRCERVRTRRVRRRLTHDEVSDICRVDRVARTRLQRACANLTVESRAAIARRVLYGVLRRTTREVTRHDLVRDGEKLSDAEC